MEGGHSKTIAVVVLLMILSMAFGTQLQDVDQKIHFWSCSKHCGFKCLPALPAPGPYAACFAICMASCRRHISPTLYDCTTNCTISTVGNIFPGTFLYNLYTL